ncbi:hypothetical protein OG864_01930 [Streptomyces sp. NBC_00124]|uniref:hypothetical protein n=1 Tax=Streptomyces sp. NBC_00124 TaxID=2975662 RepID=UPI00225B7FD7|nr:hypothetical protein [Streptomyces sp. NBC_00124]MCX5357516.1 hypothetical protein [Streptomyces sp. NBC_00124]
MRRQILNQALHRMTRELGPCRPWDATLAFQSMKALALPYELHPAWKDNWYP